MNRLRRNNILLTGATGLLGSRLLRVLIEKTNSKISLLIRGTTKNEVKKRIKDLLGLFQGEQFSSDKFDVGSRIRIFQGDLSERNLGLNKQEQCYLSEHVNQIYHCAALTSFTEDLDGLCKVNLNGTKNLFDFAKSFKSIDSIEYISTIFVVGNFRGVFSEKDLMMEQGFNNFYEQSKFEAEKLILNEYCDLRFLVRIYRPGVIVGDYPDGEILNPGLLYKLFRLLRMGTLSYLPVNSDAKLNIVPANIAAEMIHTISKNYSDERTYHILMPAGIKIRSMINYICSYIKMTPPKILTFDEFESIGFSPATKKFSEPFLPYFKFKALIDSSRTISGLRASNFYFPQLDKQFLCTLFEYYYHHSLNKESPSIL